MVEISEEIVRAIERELNTYEAVMTDPSTLQRLQAVRIARAIAPALIAQGRRQGLERAAEVADAQRPSQLVHYDDMGDVDPHDLGAARMQTRIAAAIRAEAKKGAGNGR